MVHAWGGYSNGDIPLDAMIAVQGGNYFEPDMAARMTYLLDTCAAQGVDIHINEGYRPRGSESDQYVTDETQTSTGGSNQWFQWGRYQRGETPSAGWPPAGTSHGWGLAADINPGRGTPLVVDLCAQLGLIFTIESEPWHIAADGTPTIDYTPKPIKKKRKEMIAIQAQSTGAVYLIGKEYLKHIVPSEWAQISPTYASDFVGGLSDDAVIQWCTAHGIPADKPKAVLGGKTWSLAHDISFMLAPKPVTPVAPVKPSKK
jgi:hypothetical protein